MDIIGFGNYSNCQKKLEKHLLKFDLSKISTITLKRGTGTGTGTCFPPEREIVSVSANGRKRWKVVEGEKGTYRIVVRVELDRVDFPCFDTLNVGSETFDDGSWSYMLQRVQFDSTEQNIDYIVGHELFHFLRWTKQVPGRNNEPPANRYGIDYADLTLIGKVY